MVFNQPLYSFSDSSSAYSCATDERVQNIQNTIISQSYLHENQVPKQNYNYLNSNTHFYL